MAKFQGRPSQADLAKAAGVPRGSVWGILADENEPRHAHVLETAKRIGYEHRSGSNRSTKTKRGSLKQRLRSASRGGDKSSNAVRGDERGVSFNTKRSSANSFRAGERQGQPVDVAGEVGEDGATTGAATGSDREGGRERRDRSGFGFVGNNGNSAPGVGDSEGRGNSTEGETVDAEPRPFRKGGRVKYGSFDGEKVALLTLLGIGSASLFETIGFFAGDHWSLEDEEITALARAINGALDTLPGEYYAIIREVVEKWFPWITLAVVAGKITIPRYKYTVELWARGATDQREPKPNQASHSPETGPFSRTATVDASREFGAKQSDDANATGTHGHNKYGATGNFRSGLS
jgi:hypothetical protein